MQKLCVSFFTHVCSCYFSENALILALLNLTIVSPIEITSLFLGKEKIEKENVVLDKNAIQSCNRVPSPNAKRPDFSLTLDFLSSTGRKLKSTHF